MTKQNTLNAGYLHYYYSIKTAIFVILIIIIAAGLQAAPKERLFIVEITGNNQKIVESDGYGSDKILFSTDKLDYLPLCIKDSLVLFGGKGCFIYDLSANNTIQIDGDTDFVETGGFFRASDIAFYMKFNPVDSLYYIYLFDYIQNKQVAKFEGYNPSLAVKDDVLFYLRAENMETDSNTMYYRHICKFTPGGKISLLKTIELDEYYRLDVVEVIGYSGDKYHYNIYDEHEYRYYSDYKGGDKDFYSGKKGTRYDGNHKEQFSLKFSSDGKYAAFEERNWNELTYIVVVDLAKKKRIETPYYGSFPEVIGNTVYFISDPEFIEAENIEFRQIQNNALFAYDIAKRKLRLVKKYEGIIGIIK